MKNPDRPGYIHPYLSGRPGYRSLRKARRINAAKETLQFASGTGCHPTTRRSPTAWATINLPLDHRRSRRTVVGGWA